MDKIFDELQEMIAAQRAIINVLTAANVRLTQRIRTLTADTGGGQSPAQPCPGCERLTDNGKCRNEQCIYCV